MTDEDRKQAEHLAEKWAFEFGADSITNSFIAGYSAASAAKREEYARRQLRCGECGNIVLFSNQLDYVLIIEDERARLARLANYYHEAIAALDATGTSVSLVENMRRTLAEYEASRGRGYSLNEAGHD